MDEVRRIADAVLYEGYVLWPYRRSALKNSRRWTFGGVYPRAWSAEHPDDRWRMRTECLLRGDPEGLDVRVRFLHVVRRQVLRGDEPVDRAEVGDELYMTWDEATEREIGAPEPTAAEGGAARSLAAARPIAVAAGAEREDLGGAVAIERSWRALAGAVEVGAQELRDGLWRVRVVVSNETTFDGATREEALALTLCSTHAVLRAPGGEFVSLADPPDELSEEARACSNDGAWPVLVGDGSTLLASPIILEDHPRIAPESPGDLFDGGEIDQLLTLGILSMTDEEKAEMRATDPRVRAILERTEALSREELMRLHGAVRELQVRP